MLSMLLAKIRDKILQNVYSPLRKRDISLSFIKPNLFRYKKIFSRHVKYLAQVLFWYVCVLCKGCMLKKFVKKVILWKRRPCTECTMLFNKSNKTLITDPVITFPLQQFSISKFLFLFFDSISRSLYNSQLLQKNCHRHAHKTCFLVLFVTNIPFRNYPRRSLILRGQFYTGVENINRYSNEG